MLFPDPCFLRLDERFSVMSPIGTKAIRESMVGKEYRVRLRLQPY